MLNRVLRHDLRTDANVIAGNAGLLPESPEAEAIRERALALAERGATARQAEEALGYGLESLTTAIAAGLVYAVLLMLVGMVFWMKIVIGLDTDGETAAMFGFFHLVYGLVLGAVVGSGVLA